MKDRDPHKERDRWLMMDRVVQLGMIERMKATLRSVAHVLSDDLPKEKWNNLIDMAPAYIGIHSDDKEAAKWWNVLTYEEQREVMEAVK